MMPMADDLRRGAYLISMDKTRLDVAAIHAFLARSYWSPGVPIEVVARAIEHSLCFGLFCDERQIGFARVVTDQATFAYLADVYVHESHRGRGLSKWLLEVIRSRRELQHLRRFLLATRDAHELYRRFGFQEVALPGRLMEILNPDPYGSEP
jgi:GNAT superfamily N-acetyltransferase